MSVKSTPSRAGYATANHLIALPDIGTTLTVGAGADPNGGPAHRLAGPEGHRCNCGRLRHLCVRDAVRAVWRIGRVRPARP